MNPELQRLAEWLIKQGKQQEAKAVEAVAKHYQKLRLADLLAIVAQVSGIPSRSGRLTELGRMVDAFGRASDALQEPPSVMRRLLADAVSLGIETSAQMLAVVDGGHDLEMFRVRPKAELEYFEHSRMRLNHYWKAEQQRFGQQVQSVLLEGLERGQSGEQMASQLRERVKVSRSRASLIVRNELGNAAAYAMQESQQHAGVKHYVWYSAGDNRVRPEHQARDGKQFSWDNPPSDGHPGQAIQCRCVAVPVRVTDAHAGETDELELERVKVGKHVREVKGGSKKVRSKVLRGAQIAELDDFLAKYPLEVVIFKDKLLDEDNQPYNGGHLGGKIRISMNRIRGQDYGFKFNWGDIPTVSSAAETAELAMRRTFVHEVAHNMIYRLINDVGVPNEKVEATIEEAFKAARGEEIAEGVFRNSNVVSERARDNWKEYFSEIYTAYTFHRKEFEQRDKKGLAVIKWVLKELGVQDEHEGKND